MSLSRTTNESEREWERERKKERRKKKTFWGVKCIAQSFLVHLNRSLSFGHWAWCVRYHARAERTEFQSPSLSGHWSHLSYMESLGSSSCVVRPICPGSIQAPGHMALSCLGGWDLLRTGSFTLLGLEEQKTGHQDWMNRGRFARIFKCRGLHSHRPLQALGWITEMVHIFFWFCKFFKRKIY